MYLTTRSDPHEATVCSWATTLSLQEIFQNDRPWFIHRKGSVSNGEDSSFLPSDVEKSAAKAESNRGGKNRASLSRVGDHAPWNDHGFKVGRQTSLASYPSAKCSMGNQVPTPPP